MRIKFDHPATARIAFQAGDEIVVREMTPELHTVITATRVDGVRVAHIVAADEDDIHTAVIPDDAEKAIVGRGRRERATPVSG